MCLHDLLISTSEANEDICIKIVRKHKNAFVCALGYENTV